jgi:hypothetical protein
MVYPQDTNNPYCVPDGNMPGFSQGSKRQVPRRPSALIFTFLSETRYTGA